MLELWAAIDLLSGSVVTLKQGKESMRTIWEEKPIEIAARWEREGADGLHIIDLDAAFGKGSNRETILTIVKRAKIPEKKPITASHTMREACSRGTM